MSDDLETLAKRWAPKQLKVIEPDRQMCCARFSPCGRFLFAGGYDASVRRWRVEEENLVELPALGGHNGWVWSVAFSPNAKDGLLFTADSWGHIRAWPYAEENPKPRWTNEAAHDGWIYGLSVRPDGSAIATAGRDRVVRVWSADDGKLKQELNGHEDDVYALAFHPDGKSIVSGDLKGKLNQWDLAKGQTVRSFDASDLYKLDRIQDVGGLRVITFDAEGKTLFAAGTAPTHGATVQGIPTVLLFDWQSGKQTKAIKVGQEKDGHVHDMYVHRAGFIMAVTTGVPASGRLFLHRPQDDKPFIDNTKLANCRAVTMHPDGRRFAVAATNRSSNGNGRLLNKDGEYPGNVSPLHLFQFPADDPADPAATPAPANS